MTRDRKNAPDTRHVLGWLWETSGLYKAGIAVLFVIQVVFGVCGVASALLFRSLIDSAVSGQGSAFVRAAICLAGLFLGEDLLSALERFLYEWTRASLENRLKERLFSCLLHKDYAAVTAVHTGEWLSRLTSDTSVVCGGMMDILPDLGGMLARLAGALAALFLLEPAFFYVLVPVGALMLPAAMVAGVLAVPAYAASLALVVEYPRATLRAVLRNGVVLSVRRGLASVPTLLVAVAYAAMAVRAPWLVVPLGTGVVVLVAWSDAHWQTLPLLEQCRADERGKAHV